MKILLSTGSLHHLTFDEVFSIAKKFEFSGVEFYLQTPFQLFSISPEEIKKISIKYDIPVLSIHAPSYERFLIQFILNRDKIVIETWLYTLNLATYLQAELIVIHPFPFLFRRRKCRCDFQNLLNTLKSDNIKICIENMPKLLFLSPHILITSDEFRNFCKKNNCFQTLDITHCRTEKINPGVFFTDNKDYIQDIHISDYKSCRQHLPLGRGDTNFSELFKKLKEENYQGFITLELTPQNIPNIEIIKESKEYLQSLWENS